MKKTLLLLFIAINMFYGCKKNDDGLDKPKENTIKVPFEFTINGWKDEACYVKFTDEEEKKYDSGMGVKIKKDFVVGKTITISSHTESNRDIEIRIYGGRDGHYVVTNKSGTGTVSITFKVE